MIDHVSVAVSKLSESAAFYEPVLAPLGFTRLVDRSPATVGFGKNYPEFWLNAREGLSPQPETTGIHICLRAASETAVREFHDAALARGAKSAGGSRPAPGRFHHLFRRLHFRL